MELVLIRHGESEANSRGIIQGHYDSELSEAGRSQAIALAEALSLETFAAVYASDLKRASETGRAIADRLGLPLTIEPGLREIHVGCFTAQTWAEIAERYPEDYRRFKETGDWSQVTGAESELAINERLDSLVAAMQDRHREGRVALVAHGAILRRLIHRLLNLSYPSGIFFELHNASYSEIHLTPMGPTLHYLNRVPAARISSATTRVLI